MLKYIYIYMYTCKKYIYLCIHRNAELGSSYQFAMRLSASIKDCNNNNNNKTNSSAFFFVFLLIITWFWINAWITPKKQRTSSKNVRSTC